MIQLVSFVVQGLFFYEVVRIDERGNKGKSGQYIPVLTSHSVNKSIVLYK